MNIRHVIHLPEIIKELEGLGHSPPRASVKLDAPTGVLLRLWDLRLWAHEQPSSPFFREKENIMVIVPGNQRRGMEICLNMSKTVRKEANSSTIIRKTDLGFQLALSEHSTEIYDPIMHVYIWEPHNLTLKVKNWWCCSSCASLWGA